jgi:hypothetical protein
MVVQQREQERKKDRERERKRDRKRDRERDRDHERERRVFSNGPSGDRRDSRNRERWAGFIQKFSGQEARLF